MPFSDGDQRLLEELGRRAAQAIVNARLYREAVLAQERLQSVVEHVPAIVYSAAMDETISSLYVNPQVVDVLGYQPEAFLNDTWFWINHIHPDDRNRISEVMERLKMGIPLDEEYRMIASNGRTVWLWDRAGLIRDENGDPTFIQGVAVDITARKRFEEQQARQLRRAFYDPLTDLPNRSLFVDRVAHALSIATRADATLGILHIEVDRFKMINDSLGRAAGDDLLRAITTRLRQCTRPGDTLARLGGDEFGILLEQSGEADVADVAQCINAALAEGFDLGGRMTFISSSIGVVVGYPDRDSADDLMHNADVALHEAKSHGGGRLEVFDPSMRTRVLQRLELETELRQAIDRNELRLHYQPKVDLTTRQIVAFEALIRWEHPTRGLIGPDRFIPLAEENGLILPMGDWVMWEACRQARVWSDTLAGFGDITVNLNLSGRQFQQPGLLDQSRYILKETRLPPERIGLEITESAVMDDVDLTIELFRGLKDLGVLLAIDDFGTGYSSLAYLKRFPVDILKIDRSFISRLSETDNQAIVSTIIHLGHALKMRIIAEGIEDEPQAAQLREMHCDMGQGYLFARPVPPERVPHLLAIST
jgi:diguanylate cyclase (GGDEF)-like protein/PAS domain S-box-containing protein